jgi:hypothetical protein
MHSPQVSDISSRRLSTEGKDVVARGGHGTDVQMLTVGDFEKGASPARNGEDDSRRLPMPPRQPSKALSASLGESRPSNALSASPGESRRAHAEGFVVINNGVNGATDQFLF